MILSPESANTLVIEPPKRMLSINWQELWRYRDLFITFAWRDISVRYKQTVLGIIWSVFQPLVTMVIFTFIFNKIAKVNSGDGTPYPIFLYVGLLFWQYYSNTLTNASNSMVVNAGLIQKIYFPRLIIPATSAVTGLVDFIISSAVLIVMMIYYKSMPHGIGIIVLPLLIISTMMSAMGIGMFMAAINIKYRDVRYVLPFFIQLMMYVTPVIYPVNMLNKYPYIKFLMLFMNPISGIITSARGLLFGEGVVNWYIMCISIVMSFVFFIGGLYYFRNTEYYFADIV